MCLGHLKKHGVVWLFGRYGGAALVCLRDLAVLHHIAMRYKYAALAIVQLFADLTVVQPREDLFRQGFQLGDEAVISIKSAE